ncbi:hypothetical protein ACXYL9_03865 [Qipengyuania sp. CAU 1752]
MNKFAIPALAAALTLGACAEANAPEAADGDAGDTTIVQPTAAETQYVETPVDTDEGSSVEIDGGDVDAKISEDGVEAKVDLNN